MLPLLIDSPLLFTQYINNVSSNTNSILSFNKFSCPTIYFLLRLPFYFDSFSRMPISPDFLRVNHLPRFPLLLCLFMYGYLPFLYVNVPKRTISLSILCWDFFPPNYLLTLGHEQQLTLQNCFLGVGQCA